MAHQYLNDGDEKEVRSQPTDEPERNEAHHEDVTAEEASSRTEEPINTQATSRRPHRNKNENKNENTTEPHEPQADGEHNKIVVVSQDDDIRRLEALGFTRDEAARLIDVSVRINGVTLKRLQFAKWLVEQGLLDEFSVRD